MSCENFVTSLFYIPRSPDPSFSSFSAASLSLKGGAECFFPMNPCILQRLSPNSTPKEPRVFSSPPPSLIHVVIELSPNPVEYLKPSPPPNLALLSHTTSDRRVRVFFSSFFFSHYYSSGKDSRDPSAPTRRFLSSPRSLRDSNPETTFVASFHVPRIFF